MSRYGPDFAFALRWGRREWRSGELRLLFAALVVAVAAVTAVAFLGDRVRLALVQEAQRLIGGDLVISSDTPWPETVIAEARQRGLQTVPVQTFPSMVQAAEGVQLADIKAVGSGYPLRGQLGIRDENGHTRSVDRSPAPGEVWPDERLAAALGVQVGASVQVGRRTLRVGAILTQEPDRSFNLFALAPRLLMHVDDLADSGLNGFGARVRHRWLIAGAEADAFKRWLEPRLSRGQRLEDLENARPEIRSALDRAQRFLGLASVLTVILAAVATALTTRRYLQRHLDACAILRCLGCTQADVLRLHAWLFVFITLAAAVLGSLAGALAQTVLADGLSRMAGFSLPAPGWTPMLWGGAVAAVLLFGFAFPPLLQLARVPTLRVLRRELGAPVPGLLGAYGLGYAALAALVVLLAGDLRLGALAAAGFTGALLVFWGVARGAVAGLVRLRGGGFGWRQGLASLGRHQASAVLQVVALAIGLMALLLLAVTRGQLLDTWQNALPPDAPNRFAINIQPDQRQAVQDWLAGQGITAELSPMVRARLLAIDGRPVSAASFPEDERAQRLIEREFNLSWRAELPAGNRVSAGQWFGRTASAEASVEAGLAKTLGIALGDELQFTVAGVEKRLRVTSLRELEWGSMQVNFFVIASPGALDDAPASYITSFHLPAARISASTALVRAFPNLTLIDVAALVDQFQAVMGQVAQAVQFVFLFTLAAGGLVLYTALLGAFDERRHEIALLRALGARHLQLRQALLVELAASGALAGLIAGLGASLTGHLIARKVFELDLPLAPGVLLGALVAGALLSTLIGWLALGRLLETPPLQVLRQGG